MQGTLGVVLEAELQSMVEGLRQLPQKVLWKCSKADLPGRPAALQSTVHMGG